MDGKAEAFSKHSLAPSILADSISRQNLIRSPNSNQHYKKHKERVAKENKYYFNNFYLKKNGSVSNKKENYSYHSRKGFSKSKQSHLFGNQNKRVTHFVGARKKEDNSKLTANLKGIYAKQFLLFNKSGNAGGSKLLGSINKRRSEIVDDNSDSFLQKIWPKNKNKPARKESIYETVAKHNRRHQKSNSKAVSQLCEIIREKKACLNKEKGGSTRNNKLGASSTSDLSKIFLQSGRFKKSFVLSSNHGSPIGNSKKRSPKVTATAAKFSMNGFLNSNRFIKNFEKKDKQESQKKRQKGLFCKLDHIKKKDHKIVRIGFISSSL